MAVVDVRVLEHRIDGFGVGKVFDVVSYSICVCRVHGLAEGLEVLGEVGLGVLGGRKTGFDVTDKRHLVA